MKRNLVNQLVQLTIEKAKKDGKHPLEIIDEIKQLIEHKRKMERERILQVLSTNITSN